MLSTFSALLALFSGQYQLPKTPAGDRLGEFVVAFNAKDESKLRSMILGGTTPETDRKARIDDFIKRIIAIAKDLSPIEVVDVIKDTPDTIVATLKDKPDQQGQCLKIVVEKDDPHRLLSVRFGDPASLVNERPRKDYKWSALPNLAEQIMNDYGLPAISIAYSQGGKVVAQTAIGVRSILNPDEKVTVDDLWLVGSIGKSMTATMVGVLIDKGVMRWDMTIGEALPGVPMREEYKKVTVDQLLHHRGGIPRDTNFSGETVDKIVGTAKTPLEIRTVYVADLLSRAPIAKSGEEMIYSNGGYSIVGHMAEVLAGKPYEQLMKELVFEPLGMSTATVGNPGVDGMPGGKGQPHGHAFGRRGPEPALIAAPLAYMAAPAGLGVACSIGDLCRFATFHLESLRGKESLLKLDTVKRLHAAPIVEGQQEYACGWLITRNETPSILHEHNGSDGTFFANMAIWPDEDIAVVSVTNMGGDTNPAATKQAVMSVERQLRK